MRNEAFGEIIWLLLPSGLLPVTRLLAFNFTTLDLFQKWIYCSY
jgi:hypothetical protein